nr:AsE1 [Pteris vittata]
MELASTRSVVLGSFAFLVFWVTATFPKFLGLPIGRTAGALVGATLMVVFQVDSPDEAYASINLPILGLLFGTMVVSVYLQRADMFKYLASALSYRCRGGKDLLCRLSFLVAISSALFTNDTCCVLFTEFILAFCKEKGLPPQPFLLALATSANIGSAATPIGNPQNLVIAIQSRISFGKFMLGILPAMLVGVTLNLALLLAMYWKQLSEIPMRKSELKTIDLSEVKRVEARIQQSAGDVEEGRQQKSMELDDAVAFHNCQSLGSINDEKSNSVASQCADFHEPSIETPWENQVTVMEHASGKMGVDDMAEAHSQFSTLPTKKASPEDFAQVVCIPIPSEAEMLERRAMASPSSTPSVESSPAPFPPSSNQNRLKVWRSRMWKISVYLVALGMLAALLAGLDLSWCTITAAIALIVLDFEDAGPSLNKVSYSLLVFFSGMFITVDGFNRTGLPGKFWSIVEPHARINHASGTAVLSAVVMLLSNIASNVPTVLLLGQKVAESSVALPGASVTRAWLILAWTSTVAGNLTLVGSAANLIVCEQARMSTRMLYNLSFWRHLKFGFPSTLITVAAGLPLIRG